MQCCCRIRWCPNLNALGGPASAWAFLSDMSRLGDALLKVTGATRINYAIFGNQEAALHAHVISALRSMNRRRCAARAALGL